MDTEIQFSFHFKPLYDTGYTLPLYKYPGNATDLQYLLMYEQSKKNIKPSIRNGIPNENEASLG